MALDNERDFAAAVMQARGMAGPYGKFTEEVKTSLDEHTLSQWLKLCAEREITSSELLRDLVYLVVHRSTPAELTSQDRRRLLNGEGRNGAERATR